MSLGEILGQLMDNDDEKDINPLSDSLRVTGNVMHYNLFRPLHRPY